MTKTLVTDGFEHEVPTPVVSESYTPHDIVYGALGWTDSLDAETIELLSRTGVIVLARTVDGVGFTTRLWTSALGFIPEAK